MGRQETLEQRVENLERQMSYWMRVQSGIDSATGGWEGSHLTAGKVTLLNMDYLNPLRIANPARWMWIDSTGDLRIHTAAPTADGDGTVVGTQT